MVIIDSLWPIFLKAQDYRKLREYGFQFTDEVKGYQNNPDNFLVAWGDCAYKIRHGVMETGFFWDAIHIDSVGLYERAAFNFPLARGIIENFEAPTPWSALPINPKFAQPQVASSWTGLVLACQHPGDRSVLKAGSTGDYHRFVESAAKYYGKHLFLKKHPVTLGNTDEMAFIDGLARTHGCGVGHAGRTIISQAEAVLTYNSTYAVDALMQGKHVYQFAPGYFWQTGVVQYSSRMLPTSPVDIMPQYVNRFLDFLVWKYCFHKNTPFPRIAELLNIFSTSGDLFPLPTHLSYGAFLSDGIS